jgi:DNA-binding SARP family transcriptional activator
MENSIKVQMLGNFRMEYQGKIFTIERNNTTKTNQLLQILIAHPEGIERQQLMHNLFQNEDVTDPSNSLRALVFRLRKTLKERDIPGGEYVKIKRGIYSLDERLIVKSDIAELEQVANNAFEEKDGEERFILLKECCDMYTGEFLPKLGALDWVVVLSVKYKKIYAKCVRAYCDECLERKEYQELARIAAHASSIYPFDGWQSYEMEALIAMHQSREATKLYETTEQMLFEELGVSLPDKMVKQMEHLGKQVKNRTDLLENIVDNMNEMDESMGALECTYPNFAGNYRFVKRMVDRTGQTAWILLCTITDKNGYAREDGERLTHLRGELWNAIKHTLRRGDMFTQYSNNQFLILLMDVKQEDLARVSERINESLPRKNSAGYIQYQLAPVNKVDIIPRRSGISGTDNAWL